jgi:hypothetical protein
MMSETGQGLIDDGREDDIAPGSEIANLWGKVVATFASFLSNNSIISIADLIQTKFPWYKRMHALMGTSPIVDRSAIAHSRTAIDLGILARDETPVSPFFYLQPLYSRC